jgi:dihydroneopterin aldolase
VPGTIELIGLRARGRHGVYQYEREAGQEFVVDVRLELDLETAARTDEVADTVHYGELAGRLVSIVGGEPVNLIETLAGRLLDECLVDPRVTAAAVTVHKPGAPLAYEFTDVAVTLHRQAPAAAMAGGQAPAAEPGWQAPVVEPDRRALG